MTPRFLQHLTTQPSQMLHQWPFHQASELYRQPLAHQQPLLQYQYCQQHY
ncbi:hypothetical protein SIN_01335 [Salmonella enterica subsp. enterica serovar Infantis]|nr:hypothetical protein SIN_01335 [Salmonella enterica subsp. enterica serovar Infantis]